MNRAVSAALIRLTVTLLGALACSACLAEPGPAAPREVIVRDWLLQDHGPNAEECFASAQQSGVERALVARVLEQAGDEPRVRELHARLAALQGSEEPGNAPGWKSLYIAACEVRRDRRLALLRARAPQIVFTRHYNLGGSHYAYTEGQSDAQSERHFVPGSALCLLKMDGTYGTQEVLVDSPEGVIRDPDVSPDGLSVLFAWKRSDRDDDYHLYELDLSTGLTRQITDGLGVADYEGIYLPNGDLLFNSTRCVQIVDCWWTEVSNLYTCDRDGRFPRHLGFDQVHTNYPQLCNDGRVVYTRWDYNDRGQIFPQPLFAMNPDGTGQTEFYGNNSWFPTTLIHARRIPSSHKLVAVATGHHSDQSGKLVVIDRHRGQQENEGVQLVAPRRDTPAVHVDAYGQDGDQFGYPFALSETQYIVSYAVSDPREGARNAGHFGIYYMDIDGNRELLAWDERISSNQPVALAPWQVPARPNVVDYRADEGIYYLQDVYAGAGLRGVPRGTVKALRVVGLEFRAAGVRSNGNFGPAGAALVSTPISVGNGSWDVKVVLGQTSVREDGSACFRAPARTPLYFQALDEDGCVVQTMRSWSTLQPGERLSCVGCHEPKGQAPGQGTRSASLAHSREPETLRQYPCEPRGFSFPEQIQPILDRHCIQCHCNRMKRRPGLAPVVTPELVSSAKPLFPEDMPWQYTTEDPGPQWRTLEFDSSGWKTGVPGFGRAGTPGLRLRTEWLTPHIWLRTTIHLPGELAGHRLISRTYHDEDVEVYLNGVLALKGTGYLQAPIHAPVKPEAVAALRPGANIIAVHCMQTVGGQGVDIHLLDAGPEPPTEATAEQGRAFSLLGDRTPEDYSGRAWSDSYLALTNAAARPEGQRYLAGRADALVNWVSVQSAPPVLPPYSAGAAKSELLPMLRKGHKGVRLSRNELDLIACWIDLLVPYCGEYTEANIWNEQEKAKYQHFEDKRRGFHEQERAAIRDFVREQDRVTPR